MNRLLPWNIFSILVPILLTGCLNRPPAAPTIDAIPTSSRDEIQRAAELTVTAIAADVFPALTRTAIARQAEFAGAEATGTALAQQFGGASMPAFALTATPVPPPAGGTPAAPAATPRPGTPVPAGSAVIAATPALSQTIVTGASADDLLAIAQRYSQTCQSAPSGQRLTVWSCRWMSADRQQQRILEFYGLNAAQISFGRATVIQSTSPNEDVAIEYLRVAGGFPYQGSDFGRTTTWIQQTLAAAPDSPAVHGTLKVGPVTFEISGPKSGRALSFRSEAPLN